MQTVVDHLAANPDRWVSEPELCSFPRRDLPTVILTRSQLQKMSHSGAVGHKNYSTEDLWVRGAALLVSRAVRGLRKKDHVERKRGDTRGSTI
jgi:hypothetical protein